MQQITTPIRPGVCLPILRATEARQPALVTPDGILQTVGEKVDRDHVSPNERCRQIQTRASRGQITEVESVDTSGVVDAVNVRMQEGGGWGVPG